MNRHLTFVLLALSLVGCSTFPRRGKGLPPPAMTTQQRAAPMTVPAPGVSTLELVFDSQQAATPIFLVPVIENKKATWTCSFNMLRYELEETADLQSWRTVAVVWNDYIRTGTFSVAFLATKPAAFYRVKGVWHP